MWVFSMELASGTRNYEVAPRLNLCVASYNVVRRGVWEYYWCWCAGVCCSGCEGPGFCTACEGVCVGNYMPEYEASHRRRRLYQSSVPINLIVEGLTQAATDPNATNVQCGGDRHWRQKACVEVVVSGRDVTVMINMFVHMRFSKERSAASKQRGINILSFGVECTGVLISPYPDQEGNKLQRQKILVFIYPFYNHNWRNISTIYIYI